jgi:hypothetical protein
MLQKIPYPIKCSEEQLRQIVDAHSESLFDFPYSKHENRYLSLLDYQEEMLRREQEAEAEPIDPDKEFLKCFMARLSELAPHFHEALQKATLECAKQSKPTQIMVDEHVQVCRSYIAHMSVRTALRRFTGFTLVATDPSHFWLLPSGEDAKTWIERKHGFATPERIGKVYPYASVMLECMAKSARGRSEKFIKDSVEEQGKLQQVIDVLAIYPYYYALEELHRAAFAFGYGNQVIARPLYPRLKPFQEFISPEAQLEAWNTLV